MSRLSRFREGLTLEEFLKSPGIEEYPCLEYIDGRVEAKASPGMWHTMIQNRLAQRLNVFAGPVGSGETFQELRCTFAGRSIVPDVAFLLSEHIAADAQGELEDETLRPPDIHVEIIASKRGGRTVRRSDEKLIHATTVGCRLGWLINPYRQTIDVYRPGQPVVRLAPDGVLEGEPVLPGFRLPVAEVFGWLIYRTMGPGAAPA